MDFKSPYSRINFIRFFRDNLLPEDFEPGSEIVDLDFQSKYFQSITYLGQCRSLDLNVYEINHSSQNDARVGLSRDSFKLVSRFGASNALILFVPENPANFRLSLVTIDPKLDEKGVKILKEYSNPRRYSFVLGEETKTHTLEQYLIILGRITDITDLKKRFSVEVVNKEFYSQIAEMFSKLVGGQRKKGSQLVDFERQLSLPSVSLDNEQKYKEFAVRLIGRTVFCWFLKKKKSDKGIPLIDDAVLSRFAVDFTPNFYHQRIEPLFFEVLNTAFDKRKPDYKKSPFDKIPFLNGGLFEPHSDDFYKSNKTTGTSEYQNTLRIPDQWWADLLDILETYNFTIDENTSIDIDLSVDPEMLGRIFENLLAEINPETGETARKATGSFYTPRPIVDYMINQSLKQYLQTETSIIEAQLDILLDYSTENSGLVDAEEKQVIEALNKIKILDPACGSGAFPMGMLQKMLLILQKIDHNAKNSVHQIINEISDPIKRDLIKRKLEAAQVLDDIDFDDYVRKLNIIQRSIYGVDIQPIAIEISKLRFFLSLVVDEVIQDTAPNRGIETLPNLEFKFVCANTLLPLPLADSFETFFGDSKLISDLETLRTKYFTASSEDKPTLKEDFKKIQKQIYDFINNRGKLAGITKSRFGLLATWEPFSDLAATWFDPKWMFGVTSGFDIVIGNPPYVFTRKGDFTDDFKSVIKSVYLSKIDRVNKSKANQAGKINLFAIFILNGLLQIKDNACLTYIIPNNILRTTTFDIIRKHILDTCNVKEIVDLGSGIFEKVTASTIILRLQKCTNKTQRDNNIFSIITKIINLNGKIYNHNLIAQNNFYNNVSFAFNVFMDDNSTLLNEKISKDCILLGTLCKYISPGIDGDKKFISDIAKNDHYKPLLLGKDFCNYHISFQNRFILYDRNLLNRAREEEIYLSNKIIIQRISGGRMPLTAAIDTEKYYTFNSVNNLVLNQNAKYNLETVLAILNSRVLNWYYANNFSNNSELTVNISKTFLEKLPIPAIDDFTQSCIQQIVNEIIFIKRQDYLADTTYDEYKLNLIVFKLYNLKFEDCLIIDPEIEMYISSGIYDNITMENLAEYSLK